MGFRFISLLCLLSVAEGCLDQKVVAPHLGLGKCLFNNKTCADSIICVGCRGENMTWTCKGVPAYHTVEIVEDTIILTSNVPTLMILAIFVATCTLSPEFAVGLILGYMDDTEDYTFTSI